MAAGRQNAKGVDHGRVSTAEDLGFLDVAFTLALEGRGRVHPNPLVGAVLVRDGAVVGRGAHLGPGRPHAEVVALREAGPAARGATLYCTLEPCSHQGRTPPCADAIVAGGVRRVVIATQDPNPLVDGRGVARLRAAGIDVTVAEAEAGSRARDLNRAFVKYVGSGLPFVTYKAAMSLDGKVAAAGGDARWISGEESRSLVHRLRSEVDAVVIGAGTLRRDDPLLTVRAVTGRNPTRVVLTRAGGLPHGARLFGSADAGPVLVLAERCDEGEAASLSARGVVVERFDGGLEGALRRLAERGLLDILCESGPRLFTGLLRAGLVDRVALFVAPRLIGAGAPGLYDGPAPSRVTEALLIEDCRWRQIGADLLIEGSPRRPPSDDGRSTSAAPRPPASSLETHATEGDA